MTCTPDLDTLVDQIMTDLRPLIKSRLAPIIGQRDMLGQETIRLREEVRFLTGRLFFENSADSAHDPDHGSCRVEKGPSLDEDH